MNITITDNSDGTFTLADTDRETLATAVLLTPLYKGGTATAQYAPTIFDNATVFDPAAQLAAAQAAEAAAQAQVTAEQALENFQTNQVTPS